MLIGITGMPGSGKSTFSKLLTQYSGVWIDMDRLGHEILFEETIKSQLASTFGLEILDKKGEVIRSKLGELVFGFQREAELNAICHPRIKEKLKEVISQPLPLGKYYLQDAAILFEAGFDELCDLTIMLKTPFEKRLERVLKSRAWDEKELLNRDAAQNEALKTSRCDLIIPGEWDLGSLEVKACQLDIAFRYHLAIGKQISESEIFQGINS